MAFRVRGGLPPPSLALMMGLASRQRSLRLFFLLSIPHPRPPMVGVEARLGAAPFPPPSLSPHLEMVCLAQVERGKVSCLGPKLNCLIKRSN